MAKTNQFSRAIASSGTECQEISSRVKLVSDRRGFLKAGAALGAVAAADFSLTGLANQAIAAVAGAYKLLDLPFMGNLAAAVGARPTVQRASGVSVSPTFAYGSGGTPLGILAKHGTGSGSSGSSGSAGSSQGAISVSWDNLAAVIWKKVRVPVCAGNAGIASDGSNRLWRMREGTEFGSHMLRQELPQLVKGQTYTLNAVVRSNQTRYVGLQLKAYDGKYYTARFDLSNKNVVKAFGDIDIGFKSLNNGLVQIWVSFKAGWGNKSPLMNLLFLGPSNAETRFIGENRSMYVSEFWAAKGSAATDLPASGNVLSGGLLSDPADLQSNDWVKSGLASYTPSSGIASDGTNRLWQIVENNVNGVHSINQDVGSLKQNTTYTLNAVVRSDQVKFVALQLKTFANEFAVARFDLFGKSTSTNYQALDYGVFNKADGLTQIWASFKTGTGNNLPRLSLQLLGANGTDSLYAGSGRRLYFSEMWLNQGLASTVMPGGSVAEDTSGNGSANYDVISINGIQHISPNDCAGIFSFQFRSDIAGRVRIWHTGSSDNDYTAISVTSSQLLFDKVVSGVVTRCSYNVNWQPNRVYRVGWRSSSQTGMELVVNGQQVAANKSAMARREFEVGDRLMFGSNGKQYFSNCPIGNMLIFSEG